MTDCEIIKALEHNANKCRLYEDSERQGIYKSTLGLIYRQKAEIERLKHRKTELQIRNQELQHEKAVAYKECLAKVKNYIKTHCNPYGKPDFDYDTSIKILNFIDNLVKEIVGEDK